VGVLGLSGLASGVDTASIVSQLMALERQKTTKLGYRQAAVGGEQAALKDIAAKLNAFKTAALALKSQDTWKQTQTVESSDPARLAVAKLSGAGIGGHTVTVSRLASSAQRTYAWTPPAADFQLDVAYSAAGSPTTSITVAAGATAAQVAEKINALATSPVYAAVTKDASGDDQLVLSARKSGQGGVFDVTSPGMTATASKITNLDAAFTVDGTPDTSETNVLESAIPGLRLTLKGVTSDPITVTLGEPALDREAVKTKVKAMVDAYNAVVTSTRSKLAEKGAAVPGSNFEAARGQLFGDSQLSGMLSRLRQQVTALGAGAMDDLADIGIGVPKTSGGAVSEDAKAGMLVIDDAKLTAALEQDYTLVKGVLDDFATEMDTFVTAQTKGLDSRVDNGDATLRMLSDQVERTNERLDLREKRLKAQFAAMELALQASQTQGAWLSGQLAALNRTTA
jgi:flagellar hook-associated protein 2